MQGVERGDVMVGAHRVQAGPAEAVIHLHRGKVLPLEIEPVTGGFEGHHDQAGDAPGAQHLGQAAQRQSALADAKDLDRVAEFVGAAAGAGEDVFVETDPARIGRLGGDEGGDRAVETRVVGAPGSPPAPPARTQRSPAAPRPRHCSHA